MAAKKKDVVVDARGEDMAMGNAQGPVWDRRLRGKTDLKCADPEEDQGWASDEEQQSGGKDGLARRAHLRNTHAR